jgi:hypothetical protein
MSFGSFLKDIISNRRLLISYFKGDTCIAVFALVNNPCAERIADLGGSARRRVVQANAECGVLGYLERCGRGRAAEPTIMI